MTVVLESSYWCVSNTHYIFDVIDSHAYTGTSPRLWVLLFLRHVRWRLGSYLGNIIKFFFTTPASRSERTKSILRIFFRRICREVSVHSKAPITTELSPGERWDGGVNPKLRHGF